MILAGGNSFSKQWILGVGCSARWLGPYGPVLVFSAKCVFSNIKFPDELQKKRSRDLLDKCWSKSKALFASSMFVSLSGWCRLVWNGKFLNSFQVQRTLRVWPNAEPIFNGLELTLGVSWTALANAKWLVAGNLHISPARIGLYPTHCLISGMIQVFWGMFKD